MLNGELPMIKNFIILLLLIASLSAENMQSLQWSELAHVPSVPADSSQPALNGTFIGISNGALIIAGGADGSYHDSEYNGLRDNIFVLTKNEEQDALKTSYEWKHGFHLDAPLAYGASATTDRGLLCLGGSDGNNTTDTVFLLYWDAANGAVQKEKLTPLPQACNKGFAAVIGATAYFMSCQPNGDMRTLENNFWSLDLSVKNAEWQKLPSLPRIALQQTQIIAQHNGETNCIYAIGGQSHIEQKSQAPKIDGGLEVWEFNPQHYERSMKSKKKIAPWKKRSDAPASFSESPAAAFGQGFIFVFDGEAKYDSKNNALSDTKTAAHQNRAFVYHTITDTWIDGGGLPTPLADAPAVLWQDQIVVASAMSPGEAAKIKLLAAKPIRKVKPFGAINFIVLIVYLSAMAGVGLYFMRKNKNTDDYFRGGQNIPWWVAGCSIFATMLSSITYMALPSKAFAADWTYLLGFPIILIAAIFVIYQILPFFRRINATSAYEYLELRFNLGTRLLGSSLFILFHIGRMAIVLYLSALALASITPLTEVQAILIMGLFSLLYSTLGGIEAVVWTDTIQTFVLFGGAIIILVFALQRIDGGMAEMVRIAAADGKFKIIHWDWDRMSFTVTAFWVIILGGIGQNLVSYTSDQAVVQRYMTTPDKKTAAKAILTNGILSQPVGLLFLTLGAALFVFYKTHPTHLDPTFKIDAVMPMFIAQELPIGVAGLIVAGIFAATQSTISTSMNSTATAFITDFMRRFSLMPSERAYFNLARLMTLFFGVAGVALAVLLAKADIKSMLDSFLSVIGLFGGALTGMFLLGIFTKRANGIGVFIGACIGGMVLYIVQATTQTHVYIYAFIGILASMIVGYLSSLILPSPTKSIEGLTIYTLRRNEQL
jgi:solute:Na+ symporter, SSS family